MAQTHQSVCRAFSRQLAQVLSNLEDESAQELITLLRRVVTPPSAVDVDVNGVVHKQVNSGDTLRQTPQQVYSNPTFESNMSMHNQPFIGSTVVRATVRLTSFYQSIPTTYEVGNSSGYGQNNGLNNHGQSSQQDFIGANILCNGRYVYNTSQVLPNNGNSNRQNACNVTQTLPNNGNDNGQYVQTLPNNGNGNSQYVQTLPNNGSGNGQCGREVQHGEAIIVDKEQRSPFSRSGIRFNTMGGNDLQIYVGAKLIYEGIDPGLFNRIESEHCYRMMDHFCSEEILWCPQDQGYLLVEIWRQ
ncbi:hypothetical protein RHMOL_Rhmol01G0230800 [Rhododendron molle]|uniref:Uncharacterized protein n=1 Tax=Rhododendron molle TaxID=49168 RepID=A0ACC0Q528_RHOML|nr:hypothetical protein RHMOL_Rhmol01G0230800 [Rhododendron molle]